MVDGFPIPGKRGYYAVAVARADNPNVNLNNLQGKKSCHTGVKKTAGWNVPVGRLLHIIKEKDSRSR